MSSGNFNLRIKRLDTSEKLDALSQATGKSKTEIINDMLNCFLPEMEKQYKVSYSLKNKDEIEQKFKDDVIRKLNVILDRQMISKVYDKVLEKYGNIIYQCVLLLLPFTTNGKFSADKEFIDDVMDHCRPEFARYKNDLLYQLVKQKDDFDELEKYIKK